MYPIISPLTKASLQYQQNNVKHTYTWKLNNSLLNDNLVNEEGKKEIKDFLEFKKNEGTTYSNLRDTMKALVRGYYIALNSHNIFSRKMKGQHTLI